MASIVSLTGCADDSQPAPVANSPQTAAAETAPADATATAATAEATTKTPAAMQDVANEPKPGAPSGPTELNLEIIRFTVLGSWKQVKPANNIIEAEFELPRAIGDEYDGRLTLMSAGGEIEEIIDTRAAEFDRDADEGPKRETLKIGDIEATWVDLRGTWRGSRFQPLNPPRPGYRMLFVVIPFSERSAFYAKLVGPLETIAAREEDFREFINSARLKPRP